MRRLLLLVVVAAIGFASCQRDDIQGRRAPKGITTVSASHEQPETRLSIDVDHEGSGVDQALWRAGDKLYFYEQTFTDLSAETPDKSYYSLALADATTTVAPIVFDIKSGAGSKTALFELNNSEERGLNSDKSYVAIHTNGTVGGAGDVVRTAVAGGVGSLVVGGGLSVTSTGTGEELCEDQTVLYSQVSFDGNGMVAPLTFIHTTQTILEFDIKLQDAGQGATKLSYIKLMAHELTDLPDPTVGTPMHTFADAQSLLFDANKALRAEPLANAVDGALFAFTTTGDVALSAETSTRVRIPINWTGSYKGLSNKRVRVEIGMKVNATGTEEAAVSAHYFDKPAAAERPTFEIGKTYVKAITAAPLLLSDDILPFIPDPIFRARCAQYDTNKDGKLTPAEAQAVTIMNVGGYGIASLDGIEHFTGLTELTFSYNQLTSLDVSNNTALTWLECSGNQLTSLDLSKNTALTQLYCFTNQLTSLDVSNNTALTWLDCIDNQLTSLDVSNNTALTDLYCALNQLTSLDVSKSTALTKLECFTNQLTSLDVTKNKALTSLTCTSNQFKSLDLSKNTALRLLNCATNQLTSLDLSNNTALNSLNCNANQLTSLDLTNNTALNSLYCFINQLTSLDLSNNTALTYLGCYSNPDLKQIFVWNDFDLANPNNSIAKIYKDGHSLFAIDSYLATDIYPFITDANFKSFCAQYDTNKDGKLTVAEARAVKTMEVIGKNIASLAGIDYFTSLTKLSCHYNKLTSLDMTKNKALTHLVCNDNQLTSLDVSKSTALTKLECFSNPLTSLDVTKNTKLTWLDFRSNQLTSLDLSKNTALEVLNCFDNKLTSLDLIYNPDLATLLCNVNKFVFLNLSNNTKLADLVCSSNPDLKQIFVWSNFDLVTPTNSIAKINKDDHSLFTTDSYLATDIYSFITDANFKAFCAQYDTDKDGKLTVAEAQAVTEMDVNGKNIASLAGIDYFTSLTKLDCYDNKLPNLDLSKNTKLTEINCSGNRLISLNVTSSTALATLNCAENKLTALDLSRNVALTSLRLSDNLFATIDLSKNVALKAIDCSINQLVGIDLSANKALTTLACSDNKLTALDVSHNQALTSISTKNNIDLKKIFVWAYFDLGTPTNSIKSISIDTYTAFDMDDILPFIPDAEFRRFLIEGKDPNRDGKLSWDEAQAVNGIKIEATLYRVASLAGIEYFKELSTLYCNNHQLTSLDLSKNTKLTELVCSTNQLTSLDVSGCTKLTQLNCRTNQLTSLDVSKNTALTTFYCYDNQLTSLDVTKNTALTYLECRTNQLTSLDVTKNTALTYLTCYTNQLTSMDVTNNTALIELRCATNQLTTLDLSKNTALGTLSCADNQFKSLDISTNMALTDLRCGNNSLLTQIFVWSTFDLVTPTNSIATIMKDGHSLFESANFFEFITDANFLDYCKQFDTNTNGRLSLAEVQAVSEIDVNKKNIASLAGIEHFTELITLKCRENQLTSLNVTKSPKLKTLDCYGNQLKSLDISMNTALSMFDCRVNHDLTLIFVWSAFDLENPSTSIASAVKDNQSIYTFANLLSHIPDANFRAACAQYDTNKDGKLTYSETQAVKTMDVNGKSIASLAGVEYFTSLTTLRCESNQLTSLDVSNNTKLTHLYGGNNKLTSLNVRGATKLFLLQCFNNQLTSLDISTNTELNYYYSEGNPGLTQIFVWSTFDLTNPFNSIKNMSKDNHSIFTRR